MRLGSRNAGNTIRPWTARNLSATSVMELEKSLARAEARQQALLPTPESATKRSLLAREDWLIRCLGEELSRRLSPQRRSL